MPETLTAAQLSAVQTIKGPLLILAGPGSGKTRVVTHRTAHMIQEGVSPRRILTLTFTNKAADEMQSRLSDLIGETRVWTSTFHKFCSKTLREFGGHVGLEENFTIYDTNDSQKALKQTVEEHGIELYKFSEGQVLSKISDLKSQLVSAEDFQARPGAPLEAIVQKIYPLFQKKLLQSNAVDFDDLLMHVATLLMSSSEIRADLDARHEYIAVDEYQDTNYAQYVILKLLSIDHRNLAVTGDPDQSIYGWRGANIRNILDFEKDFPETRVVRLEQNYRSTPNILEVADQLISYNTQRKPKELFTENPAGERVRLIAFPTQNDEANLIAEQIQQQITSGRRQPRDMAIFYRTNALSRTLEHSLRTLGIPYQVVKGHEFYQRKEIKDVLAYLHLINNPRNDVAFERIINVPSRKIGKVTIDRLKQYAYQYGICLLEAAMNCEKISAFKGVAKKNVRAFADMMLRLRESATELVSSVITKVYLETGYREVLLSSGNVDDEERAANLDELLNAAHEFDLDYGELGGLDMYLDQASLVSDVDAWDTDDNRVTLMTLHAAKGLEFPLVYIVALEDGILPHSRSMDTDTGLEEERRLFFVGITRAREELQISRAMYRSQKGRLWPTIPSAFLMEVPRENMEVHEPNRGGMGDFENDDDQYFSEDTFEEMSFQVEAQDFGSAPDAALDATPGNQREVSQADSSDSPTKESDPSDLPAAVLPGRNFEGAQSASRTNEGSSELGGIAGLQLKTAAELLDESNPTANPSSPSDDGIRLPPSAFSEQMKVTHPRYGIGQIQSISSAGSKQTAVVEFEAVGPKKFVLSHCPLKPLEE